MGKHKNANHEAKKASSEDPIPVAQRKDELRRTAAKPALQGQLAKLVQSDKPQVKKLVAKLASNKAQQSQPEPAGNSNSSNHREPTGNSGNGRARAETKESKPLFDPKAIAEKHGWVYTDQAKCIPDGKGWIITQIKLMGGLDGLSMSHLLVHATEAAYNAVKDLPILQHCTLAAQEKAITIGALILGASTQEEMKFIHTATETAKKEAIQRCIDNTEHGACVDAVSFASQAVDPTGQTVLTV